MKIGSHINSTLLHQVKNVAKHLPVHFLINALFVLLSKNYFRKEEKKGNFSKRLNSDYK